jgi:hypothetical protein
VRLSLRLETVTLFELVLFEPDGDPTEIHELTAATEIPFGFVPDESWYEEDDE